MEPQFQVETSLHCLFILKKCLFPVLTINTQHFRHFTFFPHHNEYALQCCLNSLSILSPLPQSFLHQHFLKNYRSRFNKAQLAIIIASTIDTSQSLYENILWHCLSFPSSLSPLLPYSLHQWNYKKQRESIAQGGMPPFF